MLPDARYDNRSFRVCIRVVHIHQFDQCSSGKYTIGLGQEQMSFCGDNEDVVSLSLTVTDALLRNYNIDPSSIGFLAVGTETLIDKSKSVKTELMRLFGDNLDIEGVDVKNACYGGTQAMFHAVDWVYANYTTERRNAIAVLADIAIYEPGPARATGGAGAIAVLITPDAPIAFERGLRATHMSSTWDFYKPIYGMSTEYPTVDGPVSLHSYMMALDGCYRCYREKAAKLYEQGQMLLTSGCVIFNLGFLFRRVTCILFRRYVPFTIYSYGPKSIGAVDLQQIIIFFSFFEDREVMKTLLKGSEEVWKAKTSPYLTLNRRIGNMYTPSLFAQLLAYIASGKSDELNRILFFAYGSGSAAAMFSATIDHSSQHFQRMVEISRNAIARLDERRVCTPEQYTDVMKLREDFLVADVPAVPKSNFSGRCGSVMFPGTYFLSAMDEKYRRSYDFVPISTVTHVNVNGYYNGISNVNADDHTAAISL
ncbi:hydroxymethylglutaryl-CoA synthase [Oesophagostomum dentatum]|uniref:Hydroxymethylglutaryl-CoA synthase n=1 Tax=Oesophagostomum dentatum TaxID=61180 RepID=A0A0B1T4Q8_OESDE|nr:hydroxymethylglutaryl-CoA synthase [Oesophagostomum dentatum]